MVADAYVQEQAAKRRRRQVKSQRAIVGASLDVIKERRTQRPEARSAARSEAIKQGKEKRAAAQSVKKAEKAKTAAGQAKGQATGRYVLPRGFNPSPMSLTIVQCRRQASCQGRCIEAKTHHPLSPTSTNLSFHERNGTDRDMGCF